MTKNLTETTDEPVSNMDNNTENPKPEVKMKTYRKAVLSNMTIFIWVLLVFSVASKISSSESGGSLKFLSIEYFVRTLWPVVMIIAANIMKKCL